MYGQIHLPIKDMVLDKHGRKTWKEILKVSGLDDETDFLVFQSYPDDKTYALLRAVCQVSGTSWENVLEDFGDYFVQYCFRHGYDQLLRILGHDFKSFIRNLDTLHSYLARTYTKLRFPSFRCENRDDHSVYLHYLTERTNLHPLVQGLAKAVCRDIYQQTASIEVESIKTVQTDTGSEREHVTFIVKLENIEKQHREVEINTPHSSDFVLSGPHVCKAMPYHLVFDENLRVMQFGSMILKLLKTTINPGTTLITSLFSIMHPPMKFELKNILLYSNSIFYLSAKNTRNSKQLVLRGEMMWLPEIRHMIYICSPRLTSLHELTTLNMFLSDIPKYDVTRDLILLNQQRIAEIDIAKKLDETTAELKKTSRLLEEEKHKTDQLLYQMLPPKVANDLKNGFSIAAEKFENVTILFSDIVTFTNIASSCSPMDVVSMLNDLYERFDKKTNEHDVYKVETIGDAYMVVNGCPDIKEIHAQGIAEFAMDIINETGRVKSPATGQSLQIRVGFHSGPVVAGVVGVKMPRYCLFGDTVNTSSRMESHGIPGRVHVSPQSYSLLVNGGCVFRDRGLINVKGKGLLNTYFLIGLSDDTISEPEDGFLGLPVVSKMSPGGLEMKKAPIQNGSVKSTKMKNGLRKGGNTHNISETCVLL